MKTKHILWLLPLLVAGCADTDPSQIKEKLLGGPTEERIIPVGILPINEVNGIISNTYPGYLEEGQSVDMAFKYGGTLQQLNVKEGSVVRKCQVLARVASPQMESTQRSATATLEQASCWCRLRNKQTQLRTVITKPPGGAKTDGKISANP